MLRELTEPLVTIAGLIALVAIISVIVSKRSNTSAVVQSIASGYANNIGVAEAPVTGTPVRLDLSYPNSELGFGGFSPFISGGAFG